MPFVGQTVYLPKLLRYSRHKTKDVESYMSGKLLNKTNNKTNLLLNHLDLHSKLLTKNEKINNKEYLKSIKSYCS